MRGLRGTVAFVTGANTGIGAAVAERLAEEGAHVAVGFLQDPDGAGALAERLSSVGPRSVAVPCDVTDQGSVTDAVTAIGSELGSVTTLVNNAGVLTRTPFIDLEEPEWDDILQVSLYGSYRCARAVVPGMVEAGGGAIVNVASELVVRAGPDLAHYISAKSGVIGLTRALASELGGRGVRVNAVAPGPTETGMLEASARAPGSIAQIPLGRLGRPSDVADAVAFLCSEDAAWITGQVLGVNGGLVMA
jgi:NAD(P)-dependent dehydrogenase (short-subunit alcohol dehydrogenase family)